MRRFDVAARRTLAARLKVSVTLIARVDPPRAVKETRDFTSTLPFFASALVRGAVRVTLTVYVPALLTVLDRLFSPGPAITIRPGLGYPHLDARLRPPDRPGADNPRSSHRCPLGQGVVPRTLEDDGRCG